MTTGGSNTVAGVFSDAKQASKAVMELRQEGFPEDSISMAVRTGESGGEPSETIKDAEAGAFLGGVGGALFGFATAMVPGVGPVLALGPLLAALGGAGVGAVAGGL